MSVDRNNIGWNYWTLTTFSVNYLALQLAEWQSCVNRQAISVDLFAQTHMQIWCKSAKLSLRGLGKKSLFPERQKPSADKMPPVTRLAPTCCRDSSFISRMLWIPICPIPDLPQHHLFQCGCHCVTAMQAAIQRQELCSAPIEQQNPLTLGSTPRWQSWYQHTTPQSKCKEHSKNPNDFEIESIQKIQCYD